MLGQIILQILLIALNAVFSCAEIAVISINDTRLEKLAASRTCTSVSAVEILDIIVHYTVNSRSVHAFKIFEVYSSVILVVVAEGMRLVI